MAIRTICEASTGSLPNTLTMRAASAFSSPSTLLHAHDDVRKAGQLDLAAGQLGGERLHESERDVAWRRRALRWVRFFVRASWLLPRGASGAQRLSQGVDFVLGLVNELLVAGPVDFHPLAGGDIVHVELDGFRVIFEGGEQVAHRHHIRQVHRARNASAPGPRSC